MRRPHSNDTRLLLAGVVAFLALVAYLAVAFANTHASVSVAAPDLASEVAPWTPFGSTLTPVSRGKGRGFDVRVTPAKGRPAAGTSYGAVVQTLVPDPTPGRVYVFGLWLRGSVPGRIGVELNEFRPGVSHYPVQTTVHATRKWHHFTFRLRVKGRWLGLAIFVYRVAEHRRTWFAIRGLT